MLRVSIIAFVSVLGSLCLSPGSALGLASNATVTVKNLTPAPGARIKATTILRAEIAYKINNFDPKAATYIIAPFFWHVSGATTFNSINRFLDAKHLKKASGAVKISYPIAREWTGGELAKPIRVVFRILEVTRGADGKSIGMPIGECEVVNYEAE